MTRSAVQCSVVLSLVVALVLAAGLPAQAQYTKSYKLYNTTGLSQDSVRAVTFGMEYITAMASSPYALNTSGFLYMGGLWNSTIDCSDGDGVPNNGEATIAWTTWDWSCFLWDLRWGSGHAAVPEWLSGMPGGGILVEENGTWVWYIINDTGYTLQLTGLQQGTFVGAPLGYGDLGEVGDLGLAGKRVADIYEAIDELVGNAENPELTPGSIVWAQAQELLPNPSANSLVKKAYDCRDKVLLGLAQFDSGDLNKAHFYWGQALKAIQNFKKELYSAGARDLIKEEGLLEEWLAAADYIIGEINGLLGIEPFDVTQPDLTELLAGAELRIELPDVSPGDAVVLTGLVVDGDTVLASWTDQVVIPDPLAPTPADEMAPVVTASVSPEAHYNGWHNSQLIDPGSGDRTPVILTLTADDDASGVAGIYVGVDPWDIVEVAPGGDPQEALEVKLVPAPRNAEAPVSSFSHALPAFTADDVYTIIYRALDYAGNLSAPQMCQVKIDTTVPVIVLSNPLPGYLWPPNHEMIPVVDITAEDSNPGEVLVDVLDLRSSQPLDGLGDGDESPDYLFDGLTLWLRSERAGGTQEPRWYAGTIVATDAAGNSAPEIEFAVPVHHDTNAVPPPDL